MTATSNATSDAFVAVYDFSFASTIVESERWKNIERCSRVRA
jgi:hypothetical protein